jgi:mRNA interferase MazF
VLILAPLDQSSDFIGCFISSKPDRVINKNDLKILPSKENGLKLPSLIKVAKIATLEKKLMLGEIGDLEKETLKQVNRKLKSVLDLE